MLKCEWIDQPKKISKFNQLIFILDIDCILCLGLDEYTRLIMRLTEHDGSHNAYYDPSVSAAARMFQRNNALGAAHHDIFDWSRYGFLSRRMNDNVVYTADAGKSLISFLQLMRKEEISQLPKVVFSWMPNKQIRCCISSNVGQVFDCQCMCIACLIQSISCLYSKADK